MRNPIRPLIEWIFFKIWPKASSSVNCHSFDDLKCRLSSLLDEESELKKFRFQSPANFSRWLGVTGRAFRGSISDNSFVFYDRRWIHPDGSQIECSQDQDTSDKLSITVRAKKSTVDQFAIVFYFYAGITLVLTLPAVFTGHFAALGLPVFFALVGTCYLLFMYKIGWLLDSSTRKHLLSVVTALCEGKDTTDLQRRKTRINFVFTLVPVILIGLWVGSGFHTEIPFPVTTDPLVLNGWVFEKFFIPKNYFDTVNVPKGTKVTMDGHHQIELIVRKSVAYAGHPGSFMSVATESPKLGCAVRAEGKILRITTYGGWGSIEGGVDATIVHVKLPPGMKVSYEMKNRTTSGIDFKTLIRRLNGKDEASSYVPDGWQKLDPVPFWYMDLF